MRKLLPLFAMFVFSLILVQGALAYQYYLRPPKMILYTDVTKDAPGTFEGFLEIRNNNNETMNVTFNVSDELKNIIHVQYPFVVLQPQEKMFWNFTGEVDKVGIYDGKISVLYGISGFQSVNLDAQVIVKASGENVETFPTKLVVAGVAALAVLAGLIFLMRRKK